MSSDPFVVVARVARTHGLNGEVSAASASGASLAALEGLRVWFVPPSRDLRDAVLASVRPGPRGELLRFEGVDSIDAASALTGREIMVRAEELPAGWFVEDEAPGLEGFEVVDDTRGLLGPIEETLVTGANDVWVVHGPLGEVLIPVIDDVVYEIDEDARRIRVRLLDGLIPGEGEDE